MESDDGFESFHRAIRTEPLHVLAAKWRQDVFTRRLKKLPDVVEVIASGSLARGTQIGPVHDIDLIVVYDRSAHPDYGNKERSAEATESAEAAITHLEEGLLEQLHPWRGAAGGLLKETDQRTHVVTYRGDWVGPFKDIPYVPPVDVLPAVREGSHLVIPERETGWIETNPEQFMRRVEARKREWKYFAEVTGMMKEWARHNQLKIRNLAIDVMVLTYCPHPHLFETLSRGEAIARLFERAINPGKEGLKSPKKLCGTIDPKLDFGKLQSELEKGAKLARRAMNAEEEWKNPYRVVGEVTHPDEFWRKLFGKRYPRTSEPFLRVPETVPWFGEYTAGSRRAGEAGESRGPDNPWPKQPRPSGPSGPSEPRNGPGSPSGPRDNREGPRRSPEPTPTEPPPTESTPTEGGENLWTGIFGPSAPSVPLTFG